MTNKCLLIICSFVVLIGIYWPSRHARRYDYILIDKISKELIYDINILINPNLKDCNYDDIISNNINIETGETKHFHEVDVGKYDFYFYFH